MAVARKKISKSGYILIALAVVAVIALPILHLVGLINLNFIGDAFMGIMIWAAANPWNGLIVIAGTFALGMFTFYMLKGYIIGEKQVLGPVTPPYVPRSDLPPQTNKEEVTVS